MTCFNGLSTSTLVARTQTGQRKIFKFDPFS